MMKNLTLQQMKSLSMADWRGDGAYYLPEDLEWAVEPSNVDAGVTTPKVGAVPRDQHGHPIVCDESEPGDWFEDLESEPGDDF